MRLPQKLTITLKDANLSPVAGAFTFVRLRMPSKNHFSLLFGPSDEKGNIEVARAQLLAEARKEAEFFVMDYGKPEDATGEIEVAAATIEDLKGALAAIDQFEPHFPFGTRNGPRS